jgi:thiamine monophosphate kinase
LLPFGVVSGGVSYSNGTYYDVPLTGGDGGGATATIVVTAGVVVSVNIASAGAGYRVGNVLSVGTTIGSNRLRLLCTSGHTNKQTTELLGWAITLTLCYCTGH